MTAPPLPRRGLPLIPLLLLLLALIDLLGAASPFAPG